LKKSTVVGIAFGLLCMVSLIVSFYFVIRWHAAVRPRTREDAENEMTYGRWEENIAGKGKSARLEHHDRDHNDHRNFDLPPYSARRGFSSASGLTCVERDTHMDDYSAPSPPAAVYFSHGRAEPNGIMDAKLGPVS
jgi:hypothetical protein